MLTVYVTAPEEASADIARTLIEERLAACVNTFEIHSVYRWEEEIHEDDEIALLVKTTADRYDAVKQRVLELHPYDVPCIERFDADDVFTKYREWCEDEVNSHKG